MERLLEVTDPRALKSRIQDATSLLTPEELKELKQERTKNREAILDRQFRKLTGRSTDDW